MAGSGRFVDNVSPPDKDKKTSIEVIVLGLSRTGTMSMYNALPKLGYKSYHMSACCQDVAKGSLIMWNEAITAKYGPSRMYTHSASLSRSAPYGPEEFAKLLEGYTATTDVPTALFLPELMAAYPHAKLVLTTHPRGVDAWLRSINNSYYRICNWSIWDRLLIPYDEFFSRPYQALLRRTMEIWTGNEPFHIARNFAAMEPRLRKTYVQHSKEMLALAKAQGRAVLEFDPREGWGPLCEFLGKDVPEGEGYPHFNEGEYVVNLHKYVVWLRLKATFGRAVLLGVGAVGVAVGAWWWMRLGETR